jgi:hypothetical protein
MRCYRDGSSFYGDGSSFGNSTSTDVVAPAGGNSTCVAVVGSRGTDGVIMTEQKQKTPSSGNSGDDRTPEKTIGEVKYARGQDRNRNGKQGGAGEPQVSDLEPEKQGGIGGP